jgi:hypothetical protein
MQTNLTAGASAAKGTAAKPAALTQVAWIKPFKILTPVGISSNTELLISRTKKKNQSVILYKE